MHFEKKIDRRSRKAMIDFLQNHYRYYTLNSWNRSTSYAQKVKIYDLPIPQDMRDRAYDIVGGAIIAPEFDFIIQDEFEQFTSDTGYAAGFNGRSSGYIVMRDTEWNPTSQTISIRPGRAIDQDENFEEWSMDMLKDRVEIVTRFDRMCDNILNKFIELLQNSEVETQTEIITKEHRVLVPKK